MACRNLSSLRPAALEELRSAFVAALQDAGLRIGDTAGAVEARLTLSEDQSQYLLVEEARKGEDRQVWIASWKREAAADRSSASTTLDKRRVWEQDEQILDVAFTEASMLVLAASKLTLYQRAPVLQDNGSRSSPRRSRPRSPGHGTSEDI